MPLNFHGHILVGNAGTIVTPLGVSHEATTESAVTWTSTILHRMKIDAALAHWCYYRLGLYGSGIGSAESIVLRTAVRRLVEALYSNWEIVTTHLPVKTVDSAIEELHAMAEISKEYPVMLWQYFDERSPSSDWVSRTLANLPSLESIKEFYELPHMRERYINIQENDYCDNRDREAEKAYRRALAERNKRLNRAIKEQSRRNQK